MKSLIFKIVNLLISTSLGFVSALVVAQIFIVIFSLLLLLTATIKLNFMYSFLNSIDRDFILTIVPALIILIAFVISTKHFYKYFNKRFYKSNE